MVSLKNPLLRRWWIGWQRLPFNCPIDVDGDITTRIAVTTPGGFFCAKTPEAAAISTATTDLPFTYCQDTVG